MRYHVKLLPTLDSRNHLEPNGVQGLVIKTIMSCGSSNDQWPRSRPYLVLVVATVLTSYGLVLKNAYHFYVPLSIDRNVLYSIVIHNVLTKVILNSVNGFLIFILRTYKKNELNKIETCVEFSGIF